ncbi:engulfment and cell motility protein 2-like isoform X2 [Neocloeon triangulifer]|uniref:engulfment and cell motility protein 2-like isoform X2 n=1 Tax=Neocloeon triangulifer TaxID=2078957 RepID=UPI00286F920A|nr:engulfment and cell motility protein 2-like isoform X2 [Neocloeon triangulifer]
MEEQQGLAARSADVVSVGIELNKSIHLHKINQKEPLQTVIDTLRANLYLPQTQNYALQFDKRNCFVTEANRHMIKDGDVCLLVYAPEVLVTTILARLNEKWAMAKLLDFIGDSSLVENLELQDGVSKIVGILQDDDLLPEVQELAFQVVAELLKQDKVPLTWMKDRLLNRVKSQVSGEFVSSNKALAACLRISVALLEQGAEQDDPVPWEALVNHLENSSAEVVGAALRLFNAYAAKDSVPERKVLLRARDILGTRLQGSGWPGDDLERQLTSFQSRLMVRLVKKFESPANSEDAKVQRRLSTLTQGDEGRELKDTFTETTLRLLSEFVVPPTESSPPSLLLLDCLTHSVRCQLHNLSDKFMNDQPFLHLCQQLVTMQMEALGMLSKDHSKFHFHPVLFCERAFEEMFCACIRTLNKTCKEMRAKGDDLPKILRVHAKKMQLALQTRPVKLKEYEDALSCISYNQVWEVWHEEEQMKQEQMFRNKHSFLELREQLRPQYEEMVKLQRLKVMTAGSTFKRYSSKGHHLMRSNKERLVTVKYSPKNKSFLFTDADDEDFWIHLSNIKNVLTGQNCPHAKIRVSKHSPEFALSINLNIADPEFLNLGAACAKEQDYWSDGIRMLMGQSMQSESYTKELQDLLDMHLKVHFLGLEAFDFPDGPPPEIPEIPLFLNVH